MYRRSSRVHLTDNINGTDHEAVSFIISVPNASSHQHSRYLYNFKRADFDHLKSVLSHAPWDMIDFSGDIETSWCMWKDLFLSAVDMAVPKTKWKKHKVKHWFHSDTIDLIHHKESFIRL